MAYSQKVMDHYRNPRNVGSMDPEQPGVGTAMVGAPVCGDVIKLQIRVVDGSVAEARFKTFGCASAIACSSLVTEWLAGRTLSDAARITASEIADELSLPPVKVHCSVLAVDAIAAALDDYRRRMALLSDARGSESGDHRASRRQSRARSPLQQTLS